MTAEETAIALFWANVAACASILLVFALRPAVRRVFGAKAAYRLWLIVPLVTLASVIPAHEPGRRAGDTEFAAVAPEGDSDIAGIRATARSAVTAVSTWMATAGASVPRERDRAEMLMTLWLAGAVLLFARAIVRSRWAATDPTLGPALVGVFRPRLVLPQDFRSRFTEREQSLVLAHEAVHRASRDPLTNAFIEIFRCVNWMNPLVHLAARQARADQEIACDAAVISQFPSERRLYAETLLKTQIAHAYPPLGCAWPGRSPSLLRRRVEMLDRRLPGRGRTAIGVALAAALMAGTSYVTWAAQISENAPPWYARLAQNAAPPLAQDSATRLAQANAAAAPPPGLLTPAEAGRHPKFVQELRSGNFEVVFIGDSITDFWRYPPEADQWNRTGGRPEWDRRYAPLKAFNVGTEGAHTRSVLWRLQNGELDGYKAKVFVLAPLGIADIANHGLTVDEAIAGNAAIVAEIRKRQPQAKILIADIGRGPRPTDSGRYERQIGTSAAKLADNRVVYYADIASRFVTADGAINPELSGMKNGGTYTLKGYAVWAEAMDGRLRQLLH